MCRIFSLSILAWREIISIYAIVPLLMTFWFIWSFRHFDRVNQADGTAVDKDVDLKTQINTTITYFKTTAIWKVNLVAGLRGMCFTIYVTFLPLYMKEGLELSSQSMNKYSLIGKSLPRVDARDKVTGKALYTDDLSLPRRL